MAVSNADELLIEQLGKMSVNPTKPPAPKKGARAMMHPADFFGLQSAKSGIAAGKYRTGKISRDPNTVLADLTTAAASDERLTIKRDVVVEKILIDDDSESDDDLLISRGLRRGRVSKTKYEKNSYDRAAKATPIEYATYSVTGGGYECGASGWEDHNAPADYRPASFPNIGVQVAGTLPTPQSTAPEDPSTSSTSSSPATAKKDDEIPDALVDFILQYTRDAITPAPSVQQPSEAQPASAAAAAAAAAASPATGDAVDSAASPEASAAAAAAEAAPTTEAALEAALQALLPEELLTAAVNSLLLSHTRLSQVVAQNRPAKAKLREYIGETKIHESMWCLCECIEEAKEVFRKAGKEDVESSDVLFLPNAQGFTLLHRALMGGPSELAQPYVVVEQQLLLPPRHLLSVGLPWDMKNNYGETPLWWAVAGNKPLFVDYLLELGADPNCKSMRDRRDCALHIAARRGMTAIVRSLTSDPRCQIDISNARRESPLFTAVLYNNQPGPRRVKTDNIAAVEALIRAGANPLALDRKGNNIIHVAACWLDIEMLEMFARIIPDAKLAQLANAPNDMGAKPIDFLRQHENEVDEERYRRAFFALLTCNAKCEAGERRRVQTTATANMVVQGTVAAGTVAQGTVSQGTVAQGTVAQGTVAQSAAAQGTEFPVAEPRAESM